MTNSHPLIEPDTPDPLVNVKTLMKFIEEFYQERQFNRDTQKLSVNHPVTMMLTMKYAMKLWTIKSVDNFLSGFFH